MSRVEELRLIPFRGVEKLGKSECTDRWDLLTHEQARTVIFEYLEVFSHRQRVHSSLEYATPAMMERLANSH